MDTEIHLLNESWHFLNYMSFHNLKGNHKILTFCIHKLPLISDTIQDEKSAPHAGDKIQQAA